MGRTVEELLETIDGRELAEWWCFYKLEPFGPQIQNLNAALTPTILANIHGKKGASIVKPEHIAFGEFRPKEQTLEEQQAAIEAIAVAFNAKRVKKDLLK